MEVSRLYFFKYKNISINLHPMTEFMCFILFANRILNKVLNGIKTFFNKIKNNNNVEKPVREQYKTFLFR